MNCSCDAEPNDRERYVPAVVFCVLLTIVSIVQLGIIVVLAARLKGTKL